MSHRSAEDNVQVASAVSGVDVQTTYTQYDLYQKLLMPPKVNRQQMAAEFLRMLRTQAKYLQDKDAISSQSASKKHRATNRTLFTFRILNLGFGTGWLTLETLKQMMAGEMPSWDFEMVAVDRDADVFHKFCRNLKAIGFAESKGGFPTFRTFVRKVKRGGKTRKFTIHVHHKDIFEWAGPEWQRWMSSTDIPLSDPRNIPQSQPLFHVTMCSFTLQHLDLRWIDLAELAATFTHEDGVMMLAEIAGDSAGWFYGFDKVELLKHDEKVDESDRLVYLTAIRQFQRSCWEKGWINNRSLSMSHQTPAKEFFVKYGFKEWFHYKGDWTIPEKPQSTKPLSERIETEYIAHYKLKDWMDGFGLSTPNLAPTLLPYQGLPDHVRQFVIKKMTEDLPRKQIFLKGGINAASVEHTKSATPDFFQSELPAFERYRLYILRRNMPVWCDLREEELDFATRENILDHFSMLTMQVRNLMDDTVSYDPEEWKKRWTQDLVSLLNQGVVAYPSLLQMQYWDEKNGRWNDRTPALFRHNKDEWLHNGKPDLELIRQRDGFRQTVLFFKLRHHFESLIGDYYLSDFAFRDLPDKVVVEVHFLEPGHEISDNWKPLEVVLRQLGTPSRLVINVPSNLISTPTNNFSEENASHLINYRQRIWTAAFGSTDWLYFAPDEKTASVPPPFRIGERVTAMEQAQMRYDENPPDIDTFLDLSSRHKMFFDDSRCADFKKALKKGFDVLRQYRINSMWHFEDDWWDRLVRLLALYSLTGADRMLFYPSRETREGSEDPVEWRQDTLDKRFRKENASGGLIIYAGPETKIKNEELILSALNLQNRALRAAQQTADASRDVRRKALRSAMAAIMARNMSHNVGSHVAPRTEGPLVQKRLREYYETTGVLSNVAEAAQLEWILKVRDLQKQYQTQKNEFVAEVTSEPMMTTRPARLYRDVLLPFIENTLLMDNIALSEGLRGTGDARQGRLEIRCFVNTEELFAEYSHQTNPSELGYSYRYPPTPETHTVPHRHPYPFSLSLPYIHSDKERWNEDLSRSINCRFDENQGSVGGNGGITCSDDNDVEVELPGQLGEFAIYSFLENFIRNAAKHCECDFSESNLKISIRITNAEDPDFLDIRIHDNVTKFDSRARTVIEDALQSLLLRPDGEVHAGCWGISEMRICALLLQGAGEITDFDELAFERPDCLLDASGKVNDQSRCLWIEDYRGNLAYRFRLMRPRHALMVVRDDEIRSILMQYLRKNQKLPKRTKLEDLGSSFDSDKDQPLSVRSMDNEVRLDELMKKQRQLRIEETWKSVQSNLRLHGIGIARTSVNADVSTDSEIRQLIALARSGAAFRFLYLDVSKSAKDARQILMPHEESLTFLPLRRIIVTGQDPITSFRPDFQGHLNGAVPFFKFSRTHDTKHFVSPFRDAMRSLILSALETDSVKREKGVRTFVRFLWEKWLCRWSEQPKIDDRFSCVPPLADINIYLMQTREEDPMRRWLVAAKVWNETNPSVKIVPWTQGPKRQPARKQCYGTDRSEMKPHQFVFDRHGAVVKGKALFNPSMNIGEYLDFYEQLNKSSADFDYLFDPVFPREEDIEEWTLPWEVAEAAFSKVLVIDERVADMSSLFVPTAPLLQGMLLGKPYFDAQISRADFTKQSFDTTRWDSAVAAGIFICNRLELINEAEKTTKCLLDIPINESRGVTVTCNQVTGQYHVLCRYPRVKEPVSLFPDMIVVHQALEEKALRSNLRLAQILCQRPDPPEKARYEPFVVLTTGKGVVSETIQQSLNEWGGKLMTFSRVQRLLCSGFPGKIQFVRAAMQLRRRAFSR